MNISSLGKMVVIVNRMRDASGSVVPYDAFIDGTCMIIRETAHLPEGLARIIVHNSMYSIDPHNFGGQYKLGVEEWGMPITPLTPKDVNRIELIERESLTPDRQFGATAKDGKKLMPVKINNPIRRHDPISMNIPGPRQDGAHPAGFGDSVTK